MCALYLCVCVCYVCKHISLHLFACVVLCACILFACVCGSLYRYCKNSLKMVLQPVALMSLSFGVLWVECVFFSCCFLGWLRNNFLPNGGWYISVSVIFLSFCVCVCTFILISLCGINIFHKSIQSRIPHHGRLEQMADNFEQITFLVEADTSVCLSVCLSVCACVFMLVFVA